jgi:hypothetical protein
MQHCQQGRDSAGVHSEALAKLPETEQKEWRKLWADVEVLRLRASKSNELATDERR